MAVTGSSVEGPEFRTLLQRAEASVARIEAANWDFALVPELFSPDAAADVLAKQMVHVFDGKTVTRFGRLVMGGVGPRFNLMGPIFSHAKFRVSKTTIIDEVEDQLGTKGLADFPEFRALGKPQKVEFYNYTLLYNIREFARWFLLNGSGCFPSSLEFIVRFFAAGNIIQSNMYEPAVPSKNKKRPAIMESELLTVTYSAREFEWMDTPLFGGLNPNTILLEYVATPKPSKISHPYLKFDGEHAVKLGGKPYYIRRFSGIAPKNGVRHGSVPQEGQDFRV
ncbi:MAG TPA: hypothetical protein VH394_12495 [Thermoanaerobaculia bacterium]|jgi:hypothetical protein|nr:hypothetical protein [Thermoanaerobaculia bacterium]